MSLTSCIKKAGSSLSDVDKAAILSAARQFRSDGASATEAGLKAIDAQINAIQKQITSAPTTVVEKPKPEAPAHVNNAQAAIEIVAPEPIAEARSEPEPVGGAPNSRGITDAKQLSAELAKFLRVGALGRLVTVVQSVGELPFAPGEAQSIGIDSGTQGFVLDGKAYLIADNIAPGKGKAVFMHEVGSHLGLQNLLSAGEFKQLVSTVMGWAGGKAGPEAQKLARAAMARVRAAKTDGSQYNTELVAYTIEEAINAGYNPAAAGNEGVVKAWMRSVFQQVKDLLAKLGVNTDKFGVQDLVDLAYGAAQAVQVIDAQEQVGVPSTDVQFSQAMPNTPQGKAVTKSHARMSESWLDMTDTASEGFNWALKRAVFTKDLVALAVKGGLSSASNYFSNMNAITVEKLKSERAVSDVLEAFRKLPAREQGLGGGTVNALLQDSTEKKLWAYQPTWLGAVAVDPGLAARYKLLSEDAQAVLDGVFKHGNDNRVELLKAAGQDIDAQFAEDLAAAKTPEARAAIEKEKKQALTAATEGLAGTWPYAPLSRYGNYVVLAMSAQYVEAHKNNDTKAMQEMQSDEAHYRVERVDTMRASRRLRDELDSTFPGGYVDNFEKPVEDSLVYGGRDALGTLRRLRNLIKDSADDTDGIDKAAGASLDRMMRDLHLTLLAETSARKSQLKRKTVAGANADMMRSFSGQGRAMAHYIAALKTDGKVQDTLQAMKEQVQEKAPGRANRQAYYNEILRRHVQQLDYQPSPFIDKAMSVTSIWMLLTNPAHQLMNLMQPAMMSHPLLAGKHGYGRSGAAMVRAYRDLGPMLKAGGLTEKNYAALPKDVRAAVEELANRGVIDISLAQDLGEFQSNNGGAGEVFGKVVKKLRDVSENVEAVNRLSTAMSAYRLEKERGATDAAAIDYAAKVIYESHGDYSGFNAPRYMRQGVFRLATQFRKFQLIQISMYARLLNDSFKGATPAERAVARKALAFNLGHLFAMGGVMALPGFAAVSWLMTKAFGDDDEPDDAEAKLRRALDDKGLADMLLRGAPKFAGVDLSDRVGAGGMLSLLPYADGGLDRKGYESAVIGALGPFVGGLLPRTFDGMGLMAQSMRNGQAMDFYKGMELLMPNGVTNLMKAARYQTDGISQRNGDVVMPTEDLGFLDSFVQGLGLPSNAVTDRNFLNQSKRTADEFYKQRTSDIKREYVGAYRDNNADALRETREEWMTLQKGRQRLGYEVQPLSVLLKAPQEVRKREQSAVAGVEVNKRNKGFVDALAE